MLVEDGRRLVISNLDLGDLLENRSAALLAGQQVLSREGVEFYRLFPDAGLTLATAARMSASFPYFAPAVALPTRPRRRVVDAGYFDNYGVSLATAWLFQHRDWVSDHASGVVLVQIRDGLSERERTLTGLGEPDPSTAAARGLEWLTTPPEGLFNAQMWTTSFRNDEQLELLANVFNGRQGPLFFTTATFEFSGEVSLSWYLTGREQLVLQQEAQRQGGSDAMTGLLDWWHERTAAAVAGTAKTDAMRGPSFLPRPEQGGRV
jgi:hypothetical protein